MMNSPEGYYEKHLLGRSKEEIMRRIRSLKREISRLKREAESKEPKCMLMPDPQPWIMNCRECLEMAKKAYKEAGGEYVPTKAELQALEFDQSLEALSGLFFTIGGTFEGYETRSFTFSGKEVLQELEQSGFRKQRVPQACKTYSKDDFISEIKWLHIGEWKKRYADPAYFDETRWSLEFQYSDGRKPYRISGKMAYPYNFEELTDFLGSDGRKRVLSIFRDRSSGEYMIERSTSSVPEFIQKLLDEDGIKHREECHMFNWVLIGTKDDGPDERAIDVQPVFHINPDGFLRFMPYFDMEPYRFGDDPEEDKKIREVADHWGVEL